MVEERQLRGDSRAELIWLGDLRFEARSRGGRMVIDSKAVDGTGPPTLLLEALAACMAIDVADILHKGRQQLRAMKVRIVGDRRPEPPRYFTDVHLRFEIEGVVSEAKVKRAVELSREKYCSVFHTLRSDLDFSYTIAIAPG